MSLGMSEKMYAHLCFAAICVVHAQSLIAANLVHVHVQTTTPVLIHVWSGEFVPATYNQVMSVGAVDWNSSVATFSTRNAQVDISAPGEGQRSVILTFAQKVLCSRMGYSSLMGVKQCHNRIVKALLLQQLLWQAVRWPCREVPVNRFWIPY